jgi:hypothetical protein
MNRRRLEILFWICLLSCILFAILRQAWNNIDSLDLAKDEAFHQVNEAKLKEKNALIFRISVFVLILSILGGIYSISSGWKKLVQKSQSEKKKSPYKCQSDENKIQNNMMGPPLQKARSMTVLDKYLSSHDRPCSRSFISEIAEYRKKSQV